MSEMPLDKSNRLCEQTLLNLLLKGKYRIYIDFIPISYRLDFESCVILSLKILGITSERIPTSFALHPSSQILEEVYQNEGAIVLAENYKGNDFKSDNQRLSHVNCASNKKKFHEM